MILLCSSLVAAPLGFAPVALDEATTLGTAEELIAVFNGPGELDDGTPVMLSVVADGDPGFGDHIPGVRRTGLPPWEHVLISLECDDELRVPVTYVLTLDDSTIEGVGEVRRLGRFDQFDGGSVFAFPFESGPLQVDVVDAPL